MKYAQVFPGQGSQFVGMGKDLFDQYEEAKKIFSQANKILDFKITEIMFEGNQQELTETNIAQPAIFIHSIIKSRLLKKRSTCRSGWSFTRRVFCLSSFKFNFISRWT